MWETQSRAWCAGPAREPRSYYGLMRMPLLLITSGNTLTPSSPLAHCQPPFFEIRECRDLGFPKGFLTYANPTPPSRNASNTPPPQSPIDPNASIPKTQIQTTLSSQNSSRVVVNPRSPCCFSCSSLHPGPVTATTVKAGKGEIHRKFVGNVVKICWKRKRKTIHGKRFLQQFGEEKLQARNADMVFKVAGLTIVGGLFPAMSRKVEEGAKEGCGDNVKTELGAAAGAASRRANHSSDVPHHTP